MEQGLSNKNTMLFLVLALVLSPGANRQSQADLEARVRANSADAAAHFALCRTYYQLENWESAIEQCEQAVQISPGSAHHDWLGRAYGAKAEHSSWLQAVPLAKKVRAEFEKAVMADPNDTIARRDLAEFYIEAPVFLGGGKQKAEAEASTLDATSRADALYIRARIAESDKDNAKAEELYRQSVAASSSPSEKLAELAGFYRRVGDLDRMQAAVDRIAKEHSPGTALFDSAAMLVRTGRDLPLAITLLKRHIAAGGTEDAPVYQAYYQLGLAYKKQGDPTAAANQFRQSSQIADYTPAMKALNGLK